MKPEVHHLRRFCSRTIDPLEKGTLASLKSEYEGLKQYLDNLEKEIPVSKARKYRFSWEGNSPYENLILDRYTISYKLAKVSVGILSYGYLEIVEMFIKYMPTPEQFAFREATLISDALGRVLLPLPGKLGNGYYLRSHLDELQAWYDEHKDNLVWDDENLRFYLPETEKGDGSSSE